MKTCKKCNKEKLETEFYSASKYKGKQYFHGTCKTCINLKNIEWVKNNPNKRKQIYTRYQKENKVKCNSASNKWRNENRDRVNTQSKKRRKEAPGVYKSIKARRRADEIEAIPNWITEEELKLISEFYANCPEGYEVDHIVPLQGKNVRGFHCLINLQYLTISENRKKSNKLVI